MLSLCGFPLLLLCFLAPKGSFLSLLRRLLLQFLCLLLAFSPLCSLFFRLLLRSSLPFPLEQTRERVQRGLRTVHVGLRVTLFGFGVEVLEEILQTHLIARLLLLPLQEVFKLLLLLVIEGCLLLIEALLGLCRLLLPLLDLILHGLPPGGVRLTQHLLKALLVVTFVGRVFLVWLRVEVEVKGPHRGMHEGLVCQIGSTGKLLVRLRDLQDGMKGAGCWLGGGGEEQLGCQGVVSLEGCTE